MQKKYVTIFLKWRTRRLQENKVTFLVYRLWCCKDAEMKENLREGIRTPQPKCLPNEKGKLAPGYSHSMLQPM